MALSNAGVERVFIHINVLRSSYQNRIAKPILSGILYILYGPKLEGVSCQDLQLTITMLQCFNSKNMYGFVELEVADVTDDSDTSDNDGLCAAANVTVFLE